MPSSLAIRRHSAPLALPGLAGRHARALRGLRLEHVEVPAPPGSALGGLTIAFVTDVHCSRIVSRRAVAALADWLAAQDPELLVVGGDLAWASEGRPERIDAVLDLLARVPAPLGRYVVPGNHERAARPTGDPFPGAAAAGFTALVNTSALVTRSGPGALESRRLRVVGLESAVAGPDARAAYAGHGGEPVLLVAHEPDSLLDVPANLPSWLAVAGHLHGGQVVVPGLGPVWERLRPHTRRPDLFYRRGPVEDGTGRLIYVSRGLGVVGRPAVRLGAPPEVTLVTCCAPRAGRGP